MNLGANRSESGTQNVHEPEDGDFDESIESGSAEQEWILEHPDEFTDIDYDYDEDYDRDYRENDPSQHNYVADQESVFEESDKSKETVCCRCLLQCFILPGFICY